jgi:ATP-dependent 26S proteasome regulatory subunit
MSGAEIAAICQQAGLFAVRVSYSFVRLRAYKIC